MLTTYQIKETRAQLTLWRKEGQRIALLISMGTLHKGHITLIKEAKRHAQKVVLALFINPLQLDDPEQAESYLKDRERDLDFVRRSQIDLLFLPEVETIFPDGVERHTRITIPHVENYLHGLISAEALHGFCTVNLKLLNIIQPHYAVFSSCDYIQLSLLKRVVQDLAMYTKLLSVSAERASDGLLLSEQNALLSPQERVAAPMLYHVLLDVSRRLSKGNRDLEEITAEATTMLNISGFVTKRVLLCDANTLEAVSESSRAIMIYICARLGKATLSDNLVLVLT